MTVIISGGCGFIGGALIRWLLANTAVHVINLDALTYAAQPQSLDGVAQSPRYTFVQGDVRDEDLIASLLQRYQPWAIIHLAAETHVDRSISGAASFIQSNVLGTFTMLEAVRSWWSGLAPEARHRFRFLQVSTDEVYGDLMQQGEPADEHARWQTSSPYSASKAAADHLADAWYRTYGLPVLVSHSSNNYGPWQYPEKLIPVVVCRALAGEVIPLYGSGEQMRDWLHVDDHARALWFLLENGLPGEHYNIGGGNERANRDIVLAVCRSLDRLSPATCPPGGHASLVRSVPDRPGHDWRYALNSDKLHSLGWHPCVPFEEGLHDAVAFYLGRFSEVAEKSSSVIGETGDAFVGSGD